MNNVTFLCILILLASALGARLYGTAGYYGGNHGVVSFDEDTGKSDVLVSLGRLYSSTFIDNAGTINGDRTIIYAATSEDQYAVPPRCHNSTLHIFDLTKNSSKSIDIPYCIVALHWDDADGKLYAAMNKVRTAFAGFIAELDPATGSVVNIVVNNVGMLYTASSYCQKNHIFYQYTSSDSMLIVNTRTNEKRFLSLPVSMQEFYIDSASGDMYAMIGTLSSSKRFVKISVTTGGVLEYYSFIHDCIATGYLETSTETLFLPGCDSIHEGVWKKDLKNPSGDFDKIRISMTPSYFPIRVLLPADK